MARSTSTTGGVDQLRPRERDIAFVFQSYALYPHMTVRRNIAFPLIMRHHRWWFHLPVIGDFARRRIERSPQVAELVERTAKTLALTDRLDQFPRTLSGGQRQRVALGRAMVRQPEVFLMDEPLSNLDAKLRTSMRAEISKLHQRVGGTFVYVTHDQVEAMTMGTRIALLKDGVIQQLGTPREIFESPANAYVARFIGTPPMNLLHAEVRDGSIRLGDFSQELPRICRVVLPGGFHGPVILGVRPNLFTLANWPAAVPSRQRHADGTRRLRVPGCRVADCRPHCQRRGRSLPKRGDGGPVRLQLAQCGPARRAPASISPTPSCFRRRTVRTSRSPYPLPLTECPHPQ